MVNPVLWHCPPVWSDSDWSDSERCIDTAWSDRRAAVGTDLPACLSVCLSGLVCAVILWLRWRILTCPRRSRVTVILHNSYIDRMKSQINRANTSCCLWSFPLEPVLNSTVHMRFGINFMSNFTFIEGSIIEIETIENPRTTETGKLVRNHLFCSILPVCTSIMPHFACATDWMYSFLLFTSRAELARQILIIVCHAVDRIRGIILAKPWLSLSRIMLIDR